MTEAQKRAYILADNKLAENAGWDPELLTLELQGLLEMDLDFDVTPPALRWARSIVLIGGSDEDDDDADELPEADRSRAAGHAARRSLAAGPAPPALRGRHEAGIVRNVSWVASKRKWSSQIRPTMCRSTGMFQGSGPKAFRVRHGIGGDERGRVHRFLEQGSLRHWLPTASDGAIHFVCMDWRHLFELLTAGRSVYSELKNLCVWTKTNGGMGSLYRSQHELVAVFKKGSAAHINNVELGRHGRNRTNVWAYAGMNSFGAERDEALSMHPTVKPVKLVEDAIFDCSKRVGSCSTRSWVQAPRLLRRNVPAGAALVSSASPVMST